MRFERKKRVSIAAKPVHALPMVRAVDTRDLAVVKGEVERILHGLFPEANLPVVRHAFQWIDDCFAGRHAGYQAIDAPYHDLAHTLQGTLCLMQLLAARHRAGVEPALTARWFELALLAILLHDTGYLKALEDAEGTGAKYTVVHVSRSTEFAGAFLADKGYAADDIRAVQNMIRCTGVDADLAAIPFADERERLAGFALSTADLLSQMAADDYLDKLPELYEEFAEAARFQRDRTIPAIQFNNADELMRHTPLFWEHYVVPKINHDFLGLYKFLNDPYPDGPNWYLQRVETNIARLRKQFGDVRMA